MKEYIFNFELIQMGIFLTLLLCYMHYKAMTERWKLGKGPY